MNFSTYGPFPLESPSLEGLERFWKNADQVREGLQAAMGVYLVTSKNRNGSLKPLYVGKTYNGFGIRLFQHMKSGKFRSLTGDNIGVFLIPLITPSGRPMKITRRIKENKGLKSIDRLEFALIGSCYQINRSLLNVQEAAFHKWFHVPGYVNSEPENYDDSARQLAEMLGIKVRN